VVFCGCLLVVDHGNMVAFNNKRTCQRPGFASFFVNFALLKLLSSLAHTGRDSNNFNILVFSKLEKVGPSFQFK